MTDGAFSQPGRNNNLKVGSPAPGLNIDEWVKGEFNPSDAEVYVLEFWATWCAPCRKSIPHLTQLQEEYELDGLKIVGISTDEDADKGSAIRTTSRTQNGLHRRHRQPKPYKACMDDGCRIERYSCSIYY